MLGSDEIRVDLRAGAPDFAAPVLERLRAEGATRVSGHGGAARRWPAQRDQLGDRRAGRASRSAERNELRNLAGPLGLVADLLEWRRTARTLLDTYLGRGPGLEVLQGAIRRGDRRDLEAVILFADLRDFTAKAASWSVEQLLAALDTYYQALVDAITVAGGEVLKFMGDGLLAVFPIGAAAGRWRAPASARWPPRWRRARRSPRPTGRGVAAGAEPLDFGVALHVGRVVYGNIGGQGRLDFTVIGPAVNLVSRIEGLCKIAGPAAARDRGARAPRRGRAGPARRPSDPRPAPSRSSCSGCPPPWRRRADRRRVASRGRGGQRMATALRHDLEAEMHGARRAGARRRRGCSRPRRAAAKDRALQAAAAALRARRDEILAANAQDLAAARARGLRASLLDRLALDRAARRGDGGRARGGRGARRSGRRRDRALAAPERPRHRARARAARRDRDHLRSRAPTSPPMPARSASRPATPRSCAAAPRASIRRARSSPACSRASPRPACRRPRSRACRPPIAPRSASC